MSKPKTENSLFPDHAIFPNDTAAYFQQAFGQDFDLLAKSLLTPPKYTTLRVSNNYDIDNVVSAMDKALSEFNKRIADSGRNPVCAAKHPILKDIILVPSVAANVNFPNINNLPGYRCIIDRRCAEAILRGSDIYAKGILSLSKGCNKVGKRVTILATLTKKKIPRGTPVDFFLNAAPVVFIGVGELKMIRNDVLSGMPDGLAVAVTERWKRDAPSMNGVIPEQVFMQNLPSACVPHALAPAENDLVIDLCAAPGGKTTHIAQLMNNKGLVVALDRSYKKVKKIKSLCKTLNINIVKAYYADSTQIVLPRKSNHLNTRKPNNTTTQLDCGDDENDNINNDHDLNAIDDDKNHTNLIKQNVEGDEKHIGLSMLYYITFSNQMVGKKECGRKDKIDKVFKNKKNRQKSNHKKRNSDPKPAPLKDDLYTVEDIIEDAENREKGEVERQNYTNKKNKENIVIPINGFPAETFDKVLLDGPCK
jgi:hypothetical protein